MATAESRDVRDAPGWPRKAHVVRRVPVLFCPVPVGSVRVDREKHRRLPALFDLVVRDGSRPHGTGGRATPHAPVAPHRPPELPCAFASPSDPSCSPPPVAPTPL